MYCTKGLNCFRTHFCRQARTFASQCKQREDEKCQRCLLMNDVKPTSSLNSMICVLISLLETHKLHMPCCK